jgi:hypothetical protein
MLMNHFLGNSSGRLIKLVSTLGGCGWEKVSCPGQGGDAAGAYQLLSLGQSPAAPAIPPWRTCSPRTFRIKIVAVPGQGGDAAGAYQLLSLGQSEPASSLAQPLIHGSWPYQTCDQMIPGPCKYRPERDSKAPPM